jgi:hypothetical protein
VLTDRATHQDEAEGEAPRTTAKAQVALGEAVAPGGRPSAGFGAAGDSTAGRAAESRARTAPDIARRFLDAVQREILASTGTMLSGKDVRCLQRAACAVGRDGYFAHLVPSPLAECALPRPVPPAAWYVDPTGRHQLRYWNRERWTGHVADHGRTSLDPG